MKQLHRDDPAPAMLDALIEEITVDAHGDDEKLGAPVRQTPALLPLWERAILSALRIIARRALREFWERHPDAEQPLRAWYHDARKADWRSPSDIKRVYANASIVGENRVVFNIKGNKYRLVVAISYPYRVCYVRFLGSHQAYDRIDVMSV